MIGRGAIKNPWVFLQIAQELRGEAPIVVDATEKRRVLIGYFAGIQDHFRTDRGTLGRMKKIANYFTHGVPYGSLLREGVLHAQSPDAAIDVVKTFFERLRTWEAGIENPFHPWEERAAVAG
jgi:tRNA-dihydrouridine synthase